MKETYFDENVETLFLTLEYLCKSITLQKKLYREEGQREWEEKERLYDNISFLENFIRENYDEPKQMEKLIKAFNVDLYEKKENEWTKGGYFVEDEEGEE